MDQSVTPQQHVISELIAAGKKLYTRGWVPATSGNFSARISPDTIAITVSGKDKGMLNPEDIMTVDPDGQPLDNKKPSAETELHVALYARFPEINAVLHTHSINATLISQIYDQGLQLRGYELLKAFHGVSTHETIIHVPVFENDQDIARLSRKVLMYLDINPPMFGYLIAGHGLYTWGQTVQEAIRHIEAFEFLFECELKLNGAKM